MAKKTLLRNLPARKKSVVAVKEAIVGIAAIEATEAIAEIAAKGVTEVIAEIAVTEMTEVKEAIEEIAVRERENNLIIVVIAGLTRNPLQFSGDSASSAE